MELNESIEILHDCRDKTLENDFENNKYIKYIIN